MGQVTTPVRQPADLRVRDHGAGHRFLPRTLKHPDMIGLIVVCGVCSYARMQCPGSHTGVPSW
jgi:hypothetical protein